MSGLEVNIPAHSAGEMIASTGGYVIRWNGRSRLADIYSAWSWNARVATLASGGVVIHHGELDSVEVVEWDDQTGEPVDGGSVLDYVDRVDLLEVLERWIGGRS